MQQVRMVELSILIIQMGTNQTIHKTDVLIKSAIVGALVSAVSLPFEHPLDTLKTNMQANQTSMRAEVQAMLGRKGWRAFYNGFNLNLLRVILKQAYRWPLWISIQTFYKRLLPTTNQVVRQTVTGFSITICELLIISPLERIKVWLMTTKSQDQARIRNYYKLRSNFSHLYTGFVSLLIRQGLSWSSFLASTEITKDAIRKYKGSSKLTPTDLFIGSIPVAIINTIFIMPMDCVKTYYQQYETNHQSKPFIKTVMNMFEKYGLKGLYLGWNARILQYMIQSAFTLIVIEDFLQQYKTA